MLGDRPRAGAKARVVAGTVWYCDTAAESERSLVLDHRANLGVGVRDS